MSDLQCPKCHSEKIRGSTQPRTSDYCFSCGHEVPDPREAEIAKLRRACEDYGNALSSIDCLLLTPKEIEDHTREVGGPVCLFDCDCIEADVVERVKRMVEGLRAERDRMRALLKEIARSELPGNLTDRRWLSWCKTGSGGRGR